MTPMKFRRHAMPAYWRRGLVGVAAAAVLIAIYVVSGEQFDLMGSVGLLPGATADPTGPPGPTGGSGGDGGMNGTQFQPPQMPSSMPDYQGGNSQPPLDQSNGISIYNSGNPQAPQQVSGQQGAQQPQQAQQPAHGTQPPDYQTATPYTQGPGKLNPDYQAPQPPEQQNPVQPTPQPQQSPVSKPPVSNPPPSPAPHAPTQPQPVQSPPHDATASPPAQMVANQSAAC